jgi:thioredoxin-related protein
MAFRLIFIICFLPIVSLAQMITFEQPDWKLANDKAKKENKLLMVYLNTQWCEPCLAMEESTFIDPSVSAFFSKTFVNVPFDAEQFPGGEVALRYDVDIYPAYLFLNSYGELIHVGCGFMEADEFLELGKAAVDEKSQLMTFKKKFATGERSAQFMADYSRLITNSCGDVSVLLEAYFKDLPQDKWMDEASWTMINLNVFDPFSPQFKFLTTYHDRFALKYGRDTIDAKINSVLVGQFIEIYEGADLTLFANQALLRMISDLEFKGKSELESMVMMQFAELTSDWDLYGEKVVKVVKEQEVSDPDQLIEFAWKIYLYVDNNEQIAKAIGWMDQVINEEPSAAAYDAYASLLYKSGDEKSAIKFEKQALKMAKTLMEDPTHYELQLAKFQLGSK